MSLITTARLITRGYRSQVLSFNLTSICRKVISEKNQLEIITPTVQTRWFSDKQKTNVDITKNIEQIYSGALTKKMKIVKLFSLTTSLCSVIAQPFVIPSILETGNITGMISIGLASGFFIIGTPLVLHMMTRKYITKIHYNHKTKTYIATTLSIFAREKKMEFTPHDVDQPELSQMFTNCCIKGKPFLLDCSNFYNPQHYCNIMNYDKPMDFGFERVINDNKNNTDQQDIREKKSMRN